MKHPLILRYIYFISHVRHVITLYFLASIFSYVIDLMLLLYFFNFQIKDILKPEIGLEILEQTQHRLEIEGT